MFIDGLHKSYQVKKDIIKYCKKLSDVTKVNIENVKSER